ncbi:MAG: apolipoprotein N-acyltransferase [Bacteroidales bacterium]|nr:apolipoprotein N-acyltransferase [Bacteroidales bacterium]
MKKIHLVGLSVLTGLLLSAAWPARGFVPLIFVAFVPLFFVQQAIGDNPVKKGRSSMFWLAFLGFFIWNSLTTWWIWNSTAVGAIAALGLNSLFMATVFWLFHITRIKLYDNRKGWMILVFYWMAWEFFHLGWDLSWPWLNLGNVFASTHTWIQWYEFTGVPGGTLWILISNIMVFHIIRLLNEWRVNTKRIGMMVSALILIWFVPVIASKMIYNRVVEVGEIAEIIVVQPNFDPYSEQYELPPSEIIARNLELAMSVNQRKADFIVSPESAIQENIWNDKQEESPSIQQLKGFINQFPDLAVIIGASTFSMVPAGMEEHHAARKFSGYDAYYFAYNTALYIDSSAGIQSYNKSKLTPGVEMMPSWSILKPLKKYAIDLGGTIGTLKVDDERRVFNHQSGKYNIAPIICYESVYGEFVTRFVKNGANLIFVITNDGWWGNTPGHRQHFLFSVLRAIETRRSVARSANTGISAFIDQRGDVYQATPYWEPAVIRQSLTTNEKITFYVAYGDYLSRIAIFASAIFFLYGFVRAWLMRGKSTA